MDNNAPNLNLDELAAYASAKHLSGVSDTEIQESIIKMLKDDGWKDAAIAPMISEIARRTKGVAESKGSPRSPPKARQDATAALMAEMIKMLAPLTDRLNTLEQRQASPSSSRPLIPESLPSTLTSPQAPQGSYQRPKYPHPELFSGDRTKYSAFRYKAKAKLSNEYEGAPDATKIAYVVSRCSERASDVILPWAEQYQDCSSVGDLWSFLDQQYDDPHLKSKALAERTLREGPEACLDRLNARGSTSWHFPEQQI
jgi:hypothetical protein